MIVEDPAEAIPLFPVSPNLAEMANAARPATSSTRPDTTDSLVVPELESRARRPSTATLNEENQAWQDQDDDDPGMFSFLPPFTATAPKPCGDSLGPITPPLPVVKQTSDSIPPTKEALTPSPDSHQRTASLFDDDMSPAAAYAVSAAISRSTSSQSPVAMLDGTRRRGAWQRPDSPTSTADERSSAETLANQSIAYPRGSPRTDGASLKSRGPPMTADSRLDTAGSIWTKETNELSYRKWDGSSASDTSSALNEEAYKMHQMGRSLGSIEKGKTSSTTEQGSTFEGLDPMDFAYLEEEEDSPHPEVRASVSNIDDVDMPCLTFRSWFLGLFFTLLVSSVNVFFTFRYPAPIVTPVIVQVISYPFGKALAQLLPATTFRVPKWMQKLGFEDEFSFNPGPFNIKEHTVIVIMANAATGPAYALNFSLASQKFYGVRQGLAFDFLLLLTTQLVGFGMAGICRKYLVWPAALIWPQNLVFCTLLNTLHAEDDDGSEGGVTRFKFFTYVVIGAFCWYFLPGWFFRFSFSDSADDFSQDFSSKRCRCFHLSAGWLRVSRYELERRSETDQISSQRIPSSISSSDCRLALG